MKNISINSIIPSSFRDPSGFVFYQNNILYRQINKIYKEDYDFLMSSGLYKTLIDSDLIVSHEEVNSTYAKSDKAYKVIKPEAIPFISYPYEWSFSQLKDAALTTLTIQKKSLSFGMTLRDCSAYNIQFKNSKPIFLDTLSFEKYAEGKSWVAPYRQFCRHFLAPLSLMSYTNITLNKLSQIYIDGIPIDLASALLPFSTYFNHNLFYHIHVNAKLQRYFTDKSIDTEKYKMSKKALIKLIDKLESSIKKMKWDPKGTIWSDYYEDPNYANYSSSSFDHKKQIVARFLKKINPTMVLDLGANTGVFSSISSDLGILTIAADSDPAAVEKNYLECVKKEKNNLLPLLIDITNPSPNIGWENKERMSFLERGQIDTVMVLALIHHLAISNNLPFDKIAAFFSELCDSLIIEFVPKSDSNVQRLLSRREDIFPDYNQQVFEKIFKKYFSIMDSQKIRDSERTLYLMIKEKS